MDDMAKRLNCWECKKCGREPGGGKVGELGICPAALEMSKNGINRGQCAGRCCWRVAGTLCEGQVQGTYAKKLKTCIECEFFKQAQEEEGSDFQM
jgi:hypothetical protein